MMELLLQVAALQKSLDDVKFDIGLKVADAMANLETVLHVFYIQSK
jgi:hypothetical protein